MKKSILVAISIMLVLSMASCGKDKKEPSSSTPNAENAEKLGEYTAQMNDYYKGFKGFVSIEIDKEGAVVTQFDGKNEFNALFSQTLDIEGIYKEKNMLKGLPDHRVSEVHNIIISNFENSDSIEEMDLVAGATISSVEFKKLISAVLDEDNTENLIEIPTYVDGVYTVEESAFNSGWKDFVELTVKDGMVEITRYDSYDKNGNFKSQDEATKTKMAAYNKSKGKGEIYPALYQDNLINQFKNLNNNPDTIEIVAGATESSTIFKRLTSVALDNAFYGRNNKDIIYKYKDGVYKAEMSNYIEGYKDYLELTIKDDIVTVTGMGSKNDGGIEKVVGGMNEAFAEHNKKNNLTKITVEEYLEQIPVKFIQSGYDVTKMENVSGATISSNTFKLMAGEILRTSAKTGDSKTLIVEPIN